MDECTRPCEIYILIPHRQFSCLSRFFFLQLNSLVISHFRKQIMSPFLAINAVGDYDVRSEVLGGGHSGEKYSVHWLVFTLIFPFDWSTKLAPLTFSTNRT